MIRPVSEVIKMVEAANEALDHSLIRMITKEIDIRAERGEECVDVYEALYRHSNGSERYCLTSYLHHFHGTDSKYLSGCDYEHTLTRAAIMKRVLAAFTKAQYRVIYKYGSDESECTFPWSKPKKYVKTIYLSWEQA